MEGNEQVLTPGIYCYDREDDHPLDIIDDLMTSLHNAECPDAANSALELMPRELREAYEASESDYAGNDIPFTPTLDDQFADWLDKLIALLDENFTPAFHYFGPCDDDEEMIGCFLSAEDVAEAQNEGELIRSAAEPSDRSGADWHLQQLGNGGYILYDLTAEGGLPGIGFFVEAERPAGEEEELFAGGDDEEDEEEEAGE